MLGVSRSGYYDWLRRRPSMRQQEDRKLAREIAAIQRETRQTYGYPRMQAALARHGHAHGKHRVARLMRELGLQAKMRKRFRANPGAHEFYGGVGNLLLGQAPPQAPDRVWVSDFTYLKTRRGPCYLGVIMDLYSRQILGWSFSKQRNAQLTQAALNAALQERSYPKDVIVHSDQGIEYAAYAYRDALLDADLEQSMSRRGNCYDNAHMESFFHSLKTERVHFERYRDMGEAQTSIEDYIHYYNTRRLHSRLGYRSPVEYERWTA